MHRYFPPRDSLLLLACFIGGWLLSDFVNAAPPRHGKPLISFDLPMAGLDYRGFSMLGDRLVVMNHPNRAVHIATHDGAMMPIEEMDGWMVNDVTIFGRTPIYCSRNRILYRVGDRVKQQTITGTSDLRSITSDGRMLYLLNRAVATTILVVDPQSGRVASQFTYDGIKPTDLAVRGNQLFVLDMGDRCIHVVDILSGRTKQVFQIGPGVTSGSGGIVFIGSQLYVHEADYGRLRALPFQSSANFVASWVKPITMTFVQESENVSNSEMMTAEFTVPLPMDSDSQVVNNLEWSTEPAEICKDRFGQRVAKFRDIEIEPNSKHELTYTATLYARALQYNPPHVALKLLDQIPVDIREAYLAAESVYAMDSPEMIEASKRARINSDGKEPRDVRTLITNIAWYLTSHFRYEMDDDWDDAATAFARGNGSCSEYSFVFASLCRLNNIPTRLVGGVQFYDYGRQHESDLFHRWTEVYFPTLGWVPVDVTKFDDAGSKSRDGEFLFGTPGYMISVSRGGIDPDHLGTTYYIRRRYRGGKRERRNYVIFDPAEVPTVFSQSLNF